MTTQTPDAVREALQGFINDLTGSLRNRDTMLTINHDALRRRIVEGQAALAALDSRAGDAGEGWKAIETAPFDRMVLVDCERFETVCEAIQYRWEGWKTFGVNGAFECRPTAWREKPPRMSATPAPAVDAVPAGFRIEDGRPISEAPYDCHVLAGRLDHDAGEWIMAVVSSPPIYPFTHWWPLPGMTAALSHGEGRK